jgi:TonB family protein
MRLPAIALFALVCSAQDSSNPMQLLSNFVDGARATTSWRVEGKSVIENAGGEPHGKFTLLWRAPNLVRYEIGDPGTARVLVVCDGATAWSYAPDAKHYTRLALTGQPTGSLNSSCGFLITDWRNLLTGLASATLVGHESLNFNGEYRDCVVVRAEYPGDGVSQSGRTRTIWMDAARRLILRERIETNYASPDQSPGMNKIQTIDYITIDRDPKLGPDAFVFTPPEGSTSTELPDVHVPGQRAYTLSEGVTPPVLLERQDPQYTMAATKAGIEGTVLLQIEIWADGKPHNIRVLKSVDPDLDQKAVQCVQQWRFKPGLKDGKPIPMAGNVQVVFSLAKP